MGYTVYIEIGERRNGQNDMQQQYYFSVLYQGWELDTIELITQPILRSANSVNPGLV